MESLPEKKESIEMYQEVRSGIVYGVAGQLIHVEVEIRNGLPYFTMVGYLSKEAAEAKERVASALRSIGHPLPSMKITVNLSPANIRKSGTAFDFPIAVAFLACLGLIPSKELNEICILGELGLNGMIRGVGNCLPIILEARKQGIHRFFVAEEDRKSLDVIENTEIIFMKKLENVMDYFQGTLVQNSRFRNDVWKPEKETEDFSDIKGQQYLKRAIEIAVTGRHHLLIAGSPGSGKTMAVKRIPSILTTLNDEERLEVQSIYDTAGIYRDIRDDRRPFRSPSTSIPKAAFLGGGKEPKAGELTLSNCGILFMDEMMDFRPECLEALKQPLEEKKVQMNRIGRNIIFPADFQMIGVMNPCPCGYGLEDGKCRCSYHEKRRYLKKLSGPLLDRFDMVVSVVEQQNDIQEEIPETSKKIAERVKLHTQHEQKILSGTGYHFFSEIRSSDMKKLCPVSKECMEILNIAYDLKKITKRGMDKILRLSRTIALIDEKEAIAPQHIMEALTFRDTDFLNEVMGYGR